MIYGKMSIELNDKFSQKYVNNLAGLLKLKFFAQYTKRFSFNKNLIIFADCTKKIFRLYYVQS